MRSKSGSVSFFRRKPECSFTVLAVESMPVFSAVGADAPDTVSDVFSSGVPGIKNRGIKKCKAKDNQIIIHFSSVPLF